MILTMSSKPSLAEGFCYFKGLYRQHDLKTVMDNIERQWKIGVYRV